MVQFKHIAKSLPSQPLLFVCLAKLCSMWDSQFPNQGLNPHSLLWKLSVLTTESPGKSLSRF